MEVWFKIYYYTGEVNTHTEYLRWLPSIRHEHRDTIARVSHFDWEHAKSIITRDRQTVEGGISTSPHSGVDIPALIGALYLCIVAHDASGFQVDKVSDICNFTRIPCFEGLKVTPTPAMIQIRNALHRANPTCCRKLGPKTINLYSASIALLDIADSVDHLMWKCKRCVSCITVTGFRKLATLELPPDTNKQQIVDVAIRDLVSTFTVPQPFLFLQ